MPGSERCYTGSVARHPYTDENPAAHGNIEVTEERSDGWRRRVNINQGHREEGPWWNYRPEVPSEARKKAELDDAIEECLAVYSVYFPDSELRIALERSDLGYICTLCGTSVASEIVLSRGRTLLSAVLPATKKCRQDCFRSPPITTMNQKLWLLTARLSARPHLTTTHTHTHNDLTLEATYPLHYTTPIPTP